MCAIIGALLWRPTSANLRDANEIIYLIGDASFNRGRDGWGYHIIQNDYHSRRSIKRATSWRADVFFDPYVSSYSASMIGNFRAEPTTEFVAHKRESDQQPYSIGGWNVVHNGTIANDKALRTNKHPSPIDSAAIVELLDEAGWIPNLDSAEEAFQSVISQLKGSYAILATHNDFPDAIFVACNYRPIWFIRDDNSIYIASSRYYFPDGFSPEMVPPYSCWSFGPDQNKRLDTPPTLGSKAIVICSGGMDSVVAATAMKHEGYQIELVHFRYGSRAEGPETQAVKNVARHLNVPLHILPMAIYDIEDSPLLRADSNIAGGEEGAEFAYEWVPARNLVMLAMATAFAEAKGFDVIALGNNLEEAGAYPDNEPEFIERFNDLLPFAVGDGKKVRIIQPVGNLMKHEIVELGHSVGAPLHLTWSCYRAGPLHCGTCGPCYMRRIAFQINNLSEVIKYADQGE